MLPYVFIEYCGGFFIALFRVATTVKHVATQCAARKMELILITDDKQAHHILRLRDCGAFFIASVRALAEATA